MKKIWISILMITVGAAVLSCIEPEPAPEFKGSDVAFTATPSATTVAATAADSLEEVLIVTWVDPKYAVGISNSKFRVMVGKASDNFVSFQFKDFTGGLSGDLLGKEVNAIALKLGGQIGQPISLDVKVIASQDNNNETKESAVFQVAVTPYGDLTITPSVTSVVCAALTSGENGVSFTWSTAFSGYNGVKTYELQYAEGGTSFADYGSVSVSGYSRSINQFDLNVLALSHGATALVEGPIDFRIKATNETGAFTYSNVATVDITTYVAFRAIALVGDATAGGWNVDTDMYRPDPVGQPTKWALVVRLDVQQYGVKFRDSDDWADQWGSNTSSFPSGTATKGGGNIPVSESGYYKVEFDVVSGAYNFTKLTESTFTTIGVIGDATPGGWNTDTDLTQDVSDPHLWTGTVVLTDGQIKFRANDAWSVNWGKVTLGSGLYDGANIAVKAGTYNITFNDISGAYQLTTQDWAQPFGSIGVIGDATAGGWSTDTDLIKNPTNSYLWSGIITLTAGGAKFRANDSWDVNWGTSLFPAGFATQGGDNIPTEAGTYFVTINSGTGEYTFVR